MAILVVVRACAASEPYFAGTVGPGCVDRWVVSTREARPYENLADAMTQLAIWHHEPAGWVPYSFTAFLASIDNDVPLCFYIHGSFTSAQTAAKESEKLFANVGAGMPPFRGVLWLWPADYRFGISLREQVNWAIAHSRLEALYLATIVQSLQPTARVQFVGHSLGCQIVAATLQTLAGGKSGEEPLSQTYGPGPPVRAALLAPTIDPCSFSSGGEFRSAPAAADRLLVTYNADDLALFAYEQIHQRQALGLRGLPPAAAAAPSCKLFEIDASPAVGLRHSALVYFDSPPIAAWLRTLFMN